MSNSQVYPSTPTKRWEVGTGEVQGSCRPASLEYITQHWSKRDPAALGRKERPGSSKLFLDLYIHAVAQGAPVHTYTCTHTHTPQINKILYDFNM